MNLRFPRYARIVTGMVLCLSVLLFTDFVLAYTRVQYELELARLHASLTETESRRVDAIAASESNRLPIVVDLTHRQALGDTELHLAVGTGYLAPPPAKRPVARLLDGASYRWAAPEWVYVDRGSLAPGNRQVPDTSRALAIFLDSEAVLYSQPAGGPPNDLSYVLPVRVRVEASEPW
jgi:hypothetical protein